MYIYIYFFLKGTCQAFLSPNPHSSKRKGKLLHMSDIIKVIMNYILAHIFYNSHAKKNVQCVLLLL